MTKIFAVLAGFSLLLMAAVLGIGLTMGDLSTAAASPDMMALARTHRLLGIFAAITIVLVNSIAVTYFIGASRWCKEVVEAYSLDLDLARQSAQLKRRSFPWAIMGTLTIICVSALGAASDPGRLRPGVEMWATPHLIAALTGFMLVAWAFFAEWTNIQANYRVIAKILAEVKRIRLERGLDTV